MVLGYSRGGRVYFTWPDRRFALRVPRLRRVLQGPRHRARCCRRPARAARRAAAGARGVPAPARRRDHRVQPARSVLVPRRRRPVPDRGRGRARREAGVVPAVPVQPRVQARRVHGRRLQQRDLPAGSASDGIAHADIARRDRGDPIRRSSAPRCPRDAAEGRVVETRARDRRSRCSRAGDLARRGRAGRRRRARRERAAARRFDAILGAPWRAPTPPRSLPRCG